MLLIILSGVAAIAQPRYTLAPEPVCWTTPGGRDSSLTRISLVASFGSAATVMYLDQFANTVTVSGGSFQNCFCEDLPGWVYPPPGGISFEGAGVPVINPLDPKCFWTLWVNVDFPFELSDVVATCDGIPVSRMEKWDTVPYGNVLYVVSHDMIPGGTCNNTPHIFNISIVNAGGNATFTYESSY